MREREREREREIRDIKAPGNGLTSNRSKFSKII